MNQPTWMRNWGRWRTRRTRRILVCLMAVLAALAFVAPVAGLACMILYFPLSRSGIPPMDDKTHIDERQWRIRAEATTVAYRILSLVVMVLVFVGSARPMDWNASLIAILVLIMCLPAAVVAWREPDLRMDEA